MWTLLLASFALADDLGIDDILGEIDLGPAVETSVYSGSSVAGSGALAKGGKVTVRHAAGGVTVRCGDFEQVKATLSYRLEGTDPAALKRYGDALVVTATGSGPAVTVSTSKPARPSMSRHQADLVVSAPTGAVLDVEGLGGAVSVEGCSAGVRVRAGQGAFVSGPVQGFEVASASGDVRVVVAEGGSIAPKSAITADKGAVLLSVGLTDSAKLDVRGASVDVAQAVAGNVGATAVTGDMGAGGPPLVVRASGDVKISAR